MRQLIYLAGAHSGWTPVAKASPSCIVMSAPPLTLGASTKCPFMARERARRAAFYRRLLWSVPSPSPPPPPPDPPSPLLPLLPFRSPPPPRLGSGGADRVYDIATRMGCARTARAANEPPELGLETERPSPLPRETPAIQFVSPSLSVLPRSCCAVFEELHGLALQAAPILCSGRPLPSWLKLPGPEIPSLSPVPPLPSLPEAVCGRGRPRDGSI